jgi:hypothetical protein
MKKSIHPNTILLMAIEDDAIEAGWYKVHPKTCFCEEVAKRAGEVGNDYPSHNAIKIAWDMLNKLKEQMEPEKVVFT